MHSNIIAHITGETWINVVQQHNSQAHAVTKLAGAGANILDAVISLHRDTHFLTLDNDLILRNY